MATQPDTYIQTLQTKLIEFLNDYIELIGRSGTVLYQTFNFPDAILITQGIDQNESIDEIQRKIHDVWELRIRMPIVASMKAGKSTIINAFIGSELLPTRTEAMTALPTSVVLKLGEAHADNTSSAQLVLADETLDALKTLQSSVVQILKENFRDDRKLDNLLLSNPHLTKTAKALRDAQKPELDLQNKLNDDKYVQRRLTFINELVRISIYISSRKSSLGLSLDAFLKNIPAIHVNYEPVSESQKTFKQRCQLLLIDTPGPNEAAGVAQLGRFVTSELRKADVILAVVEYGHLNTKSDAQIADEIEKIQQLKNNGKCIYVLINKADLRKQKDMSKAQLRQHVATTYDVPIGSVFQLSGSHALIAQKFLADYKKSDGKLEVLTSNTARDVVEAFCPINWEEHLEECTTDEVENYAKRLYKASGVSDVLDNVLKTVMNQVVRRCIESAIEICTRMSKTLTTDVDIRLHGLKLIAERLHQEIEDLNQDLKDLAEIEKEQLVAMKETSAKLEIELMKIFQATLSECEKEVEKIFHPDNEKWIGAAEKIRQKQEGQTGVQTTFGATALSSFASLCAMHSVGNKGIAGAGVIAGAFLGWLAAQQLMKFFRGTGDEIQYNNKEEAKIFIEGITEMINVLSKNIYNAIEKQVSDACNESCKNFHSQISERMMNILRRANDRLNSTFAVNQIIPKKIDLKFKEIHVDVDDIGRIQEHRLASFFGKVSIKLNESDSTWFLSRSKLQEKCVESVKANLERIRIDIVENTNNEMTHNFTSLFNDLQAYLIKYQGYAEICVSDKKLTKENQAKFESELQDLKICLTNEKQKVDDFITGIHWEKLV